MALVPKLMASQTSHGRVDNDPGGQSEEIEAALKIILPKPYTGVHRPIRAVVAH